MRKSHSSLTWSSTSGGGRGGGISSSASPSSVTSSSSLIDEEGGFSSSRLNAELNSRLGEGGGSTDDGCRGEGKSIIFGVEALNRRE